MMHGQKNIKVNTCRLTLWTWSWLISEWMADWVVHSVSGSMQQSPSSEDEGRWSRNTQCFTGTDSVLLCRCCVIFRNIPLLLGKRFWPCIPTPKAKHNPLLTDSDFLTDHCWRLFRPSLEQYIYIYIYLHYSVLCIYSSVLHICSAATYIFIVIYLIHL